MKCLKTGANIFLAEYGSYAICDLFIVHEGLPEELLMARIAGVTYGGEKQECHARIDHVDHWFDKGQHDIHRSSTMVTLSYEFFDGERVLL